MPTIADQVSEPDELLRFQLVTYDANGNQHPGPVFTGTVLDAR